MEILIILVLLVLGYFFGRAREANHYKDILKREDNLRHIPAISGEWKHLITDDKDSYICGGGVVIGADYFKTFISNLRGFFGGNLKAFETLIDRGKREAVLRMKESAHQWGADQIVNVRIETATIGNQQGDRGLPCIEIYAYGTAIREKK